MFSSIALIPHHLTLVCVLWMVVVASVASMPHNILDVMTSDLANVAKGATPPQSSAASQHMATNFFRPRSITKRSGGGSSSGLSSGGFLKVVEAPPKLLEARQHGKVVLACSASGNPAPEITWYKDGKPLVKKYLHAMYNEADYVGFAAESMSETKSRIEIDCISQEEAGLYECVARNDKKKATVSTEVHVVSYESSSGCLPRQLSERRRSAPRINQWMGTYMQVLGTEAHLVCRSADDFGDDDKKTFWVGPDDEAIVGGKKYEQLSNGDLLIRELAFSDMGMFKCIVRNEYGEDMKETFVYPHAR